MWGPWQKENIENLRTIDYFMNDLITERITIGDLFTGKQSLKNLCASCHNLFGKRGNTGPELTGPNRTDVAYLLNKIMDLSVCYRMTTSLLL